MTLSQKVPSGAGVHAEHLPAFRQSVSDVHGLLQPVRGDTFVRSCATEALAAPAMPSNKTIATTTVFFCIFGPPWQFYGSQAFITAETCPSLSGPNQTFSILASVLTSIVSGTRRRLYCSCSLGSISSNTIQFFIKCWTTNSLSRRDPTFAKITSLRLGAVLRILRHAGQFAPHTAQPSVKTRTRVFCRWPRNATDKCDPSRAKPSSTGNELPMVGKDSGLGWEAVYFRFRFCRIRNISKTRSTKIRTTTVYERGRGIGSVTMATNLE